MTAKPLIWLTLTNRCNSSQLDRGDFTYHPLKTVQTSGATSFYHLKNGGHVAALKSHLGHSNFLHLDIQDFFGSINKTRVTRCLKPIFSYKQSREWAKASTVDHPKVLDRTIIPYGFVQSQIIASVCLECSALGRCLNSISKISSAAVSVYVDDIIVSTNDHQLSTRLHAEIKIAAARARFLLNPDKEHGPAEKISAFNVRLSNNSMAIEELRLQQFIDALAGDVSETRKQGILGYIASINKAQRSAL